MFMWGWNTSREQCYILSFFVCLFVCLVGWLFCWRWSRPHIYFCMCIRSFRRCGTVLQTHTNRLMPWHKRKNKNSWSRNICNKFICIFIFYFVRENNIKWPFQIRTICLITENNLSVTILHVSSVIMSQSQCPDILESLLFSVLTWAFEISIACLLCLLYTMSVTINSVVRH